MHAGRSSGSSGDHTGGQFRLHQRSALSRAREGGDQGLGSDGRARAPSRGLHLSGVVYRPHQVQPHRDGAFTPGEQKMMGAYRLAAYQMSQDYAKTHAPAEAAAFERLHGQYEMNDVFYKDWSKRLIGPQSAAAYKGAEAGLAASGQKHYEQEMADYKRDSAAQQAADKQIFGTQGLSNDPTAVATRRCLELGGSSVGCMGKGFTSGLMDLIGFGAEAQEEFTGPGKAGVVLSGVYKNPAVATTLGFG